jgi:hypothetical protein
MKIYRIAKNQNDIPNNGELRNVLAFHGSRDPFDKFDYNRAAQGVFWFTENIEDIKSGISGANSNRYIATVQLTVKNTANWEEYDKYMLQQLNDMGFDSIKLDDNWVIFDANNINILNWKNENI